MPCVKRISSESITSIDPPSKHHQQSAMKTELQNFLTVSFPAKIQFISTKLRLFSCH